MRNINSAIVLAAAFHFVTVAPSLSARPAAIQCFDTTALEKAAALTRESPDGGGGPLSFGPPPNPQVGDSWDWYIWSLNGMPSATLQSCTVRGSSDNVYVVVRDVDWNVHVTQADVDSILDHMENRSYGLYPNRGIYSLNTETFGDPPFGLDQDYKIYLLYYDLDISSDGFIAAWADPYPDQGTGLNKSNECDVLYLNCGPDAGVDHTPSGNYMLAVAAHEMEHLIHNGYDANEENWLDESLAEIGMYLFDPDSEHIDSFRANPDVSITLNNPAGSYGARYFFGIHLYEEYGGAATTREIITTQPDGMSGLNMALAMQGRTETFEDIFRNWIVANFLDEPGIAGGVYGYDNWDYPPFNPIRNLNAYPLGPMAETVSRWAADYIQFRSFAPAELMIQFDGQDNDDYSVQLLRIDSTGTQLPQVEPMALDARREGSLTVPAGSGFDLAVLAVGGMNTSADTSAYTFSADIVAPFILTVSKGADPVSEALLEWTTSARPPFLVHRGGEAATLLSNPPETFPVINFFHTDRDPPYTLTFYSVTPQ